MKHFSRGLFRGTGDPLDRCESALKVLGRSGRVVRAGPRIGLVRSSGWKNRASSRIPSGVDKRLLNSKSRHFGISTRPNFGYPVPGWFEMIWYPGNLILF